MSLFTVILERDLAYLAELARAGRVALRIHRARQHRWDWTLRVRNTTGPLYEHGFAFTRYGAIRGAYRSARRLAGRCYGSELITARAVRVEEPA